ncbi:hypothetical protein [Fundidesulfovibrio putealis]|uniref:hypothetical protein n=1 Tax=Fundidesulfovibrio putealis TaxID=270496 RepID=UPI0005BD40EE|nr:hypothetical protein [Fundidesulfovibrio putealis]
MINSKSAVASVLRTLQKNNLPLDKIVLHKFLYFLNTQGVSTGLSFEPYTYGPFSFDLARVLSDMAFWDEIKENKASYEILTLDSHPALNPDVEKQISDLLKKFQGIVGDFTFDNLESVGTALYCAESIKFQGDRPTQERVVSEFKKWKGERYPTARIQEVYDKLTPYIWHTP